MRFLRRLLDTQAHNFEPGGRLERLYALWEAQDTILFTPGSVTSGPSHVRDGLDLKRLMITVVASLAGCVYMAMYNTGYQANLAISLGARCRSRDVADRCHRGALGVGFAPDDPRGVPAFTARLYYLPVLAVTFAVGGFWEVLFAAVRRHEVNEGFLVTGMLFPLILPATISTLAGCPRDRRSVLSSAKRFSVGTGMNVLNPALTARAFVLLCLSSGTVW